MKVRKSLIWALALVIVLVGGFVAYKAYSPVKNVNLTAFNQKEDQLTKEAEQIHQQIQTGYDQLEKGSQTPAEFKKQMIPLYDQMKKNWDDYNNYTKSNALSDKDRNSQAFKKGVELASNIRLDEYTFLINVTKYDLSKQQIEAKYKENLSTFDAKLKQYQEVTKELNK